ncbi:uncharacterized protein EKO05_0008011 [Ascochyta rabiei]|uniref:Uncharacterized protein n=1 Tax=Didymella rabiei TaxID=5454 RepID=A0A163B9P7_DIDRA|nr:uncharacterized protein EKO05_0008011 [Ascochyta rabiei]KZM21643.1 hypothetical protein ST47_g7240 [Ascochyta rabiei]UPX17670.1 hypothetical protein EKO05_0008011 [Ascochyta rabiei]
MFPYIHVHPFDNFGTLQHSFDSVRQRADALHVENVALRSQVQVLSGRISSLETENTQLRSMVTGIPPPPPASDVYTTEIENVIQLPVALKSLAIMQNHFRYQGTLRQCSTLGCNRYAFDQTCFREGHIAWCRTHNRIITRTYTSCSVRLEARGDCSPLYWEPSSNWEEIVACAFRDGKIGRKDLPTDVLDRLLYPQIHPISQRTGPPIHPPQARYLHDNFSYTMFRKR